jgi:hypothetical protein
VARATGGSPDAVAKEAARDVGTGRYTLSLASAVAADATDADVTVDRGLIWTI